MAETLVLRLLGPDAADWVAVDAGGAATLAPATGALAQAAAAAAGRRLVVLAPAADVLLARPELPARNPAKLRQLAPFALEESLAADVESLHFAVGRPASDRRTPVAAVERERLAGWLAALGAAGLSPESLHAETQAVPDNPAHVVLVLEEDRVLARAPGALPVALEAEPLADALAVLGLPPAGDAPVPHLLVYATPAAWERHGPAVEALRGALAGLNVQLLAQGPLPLLAAVAATTGPLSLLQGEFAVRQGYAPDWPRWRLAAGLAAAFLALHLATLGLDGWRARAAEAEADAALRAAAAEALPNADPARLPDLRAAVDARLRAARGAVDGGLVGALGALAGAARAAPGMQVESLSYRDGITDVTLDAPDVDSIDRLRQRVVEGGLSAEMQGAEQREARYRGRLQLRGSAP